VARSEEKLGEVGQQAKAIGAEALVLELDLMAPTSAEVVVRKTLDRFDRRRSRSRCVRKPCHHC